MPKTENDYYDYHYQNESGLSSLISSFLNGLHLLDFVLLFLSFVIIVTPFSFGIYTQNINNGIIQKEQDIGQIIIALDKFFVNSNIVPSKRLYPIGVCGDKPNEIDYEYTLRQHLLGKVINIDTHAYISETDFPNDKQGSFTSKITDRKTPIRECPKVFSRNKNNTNLVYNDSSTSCNFGKDGADAKYRNCYLYSTDQLGFEYQLSYYDSSNERFVIYKKNRDQPITKIYASR